MCDISNETASRRAKMQNLAAETRKMIAEEAERQAAELAEVVRGGPVGNPVNVDEAIRRLQEV